MPTTKEIEQIILSLPKTGLGMLDDDVNESHYFYLRDKGLIVVHDTEDGGIYAAKLTAAGQRYQKDLLSRS